MARFTVDGAELAYDDEGPRDSASTPLLLIHGWTADRHRWDHQTAHFSPHRRVIRLDLRGHGESTGAGAPTIDALARDVVALLDHLGVDRFIPVGHSMGGMTAQTLALTHPGTGGTPGPGQLHRPHDVQPGARAADGRVHAGAVQAVRRRQHPARVRTGPPPRRGREVHPRLGVHAPRGGHDPVRGDARLRRPRPGRRDPRADPDGARLPRRPAPRPADAAPRHGIPGRRDPRPGRRTRTAPRAARGPHRGPGPLPRPPVGPPAAPGPSRSAALRSPPVPIGGSMGLVHARAPGLRRERGQRTRA
ncbi:alpha/beta fold hydrolase [Streptomyces albogriseolus]